MPRIVIALGGNALGDNPSEQEEKIGEVCPVLIDLIKSGNEIVISHGNGPQVGMINLAFEASSRAGERVAPMPLRECTAMSQGYIGYHLQKGIYNQLRRAGMPWQVLTVITQVEVNPEDPAFANPTKPIGSFYDKETAGRMMSEDGTLIMKEDSGRGWRQLVPSPAPVGIIEKDAICTLLDCEFIVIASGGGGIPVIRDKDDRLHGVSAVIDKDFASAKLADAVDAELLLILTAVDSVSVNFGKPNQRPVSSMTVSEAEKHISDGQFAPGSMLPKVRASIEFVRGGKNRRAIIASASSAAAAVKGNGGTAITL